MVVLARHLQEAGVLSRSGALPESVGAARTDSGLARLVDEAFAPRRRSGIATRRAGLRVPTRRTRPRARGVAPT